MSVENQFTHVQETPSNRIESSEGMTSYAPPALQLTASAADAPDSRDSGVSDPPVALMTRGPAPAVLPGQPVTQQQAAPLQRQEDDSEERSVVRCTVTIGKEMGKEEFQRAMINQILGGYDKDVTFTLTRERFEPGTYAVDVDTVLLVEARAFQQAESGIAKGEDGKVEGADARATEFGMGDDNKTSRALLEEIHRRYAELTGTELQGSERPKDKEKAALWDQMRDEVLFQNAYVNKLPEKVKMLFQKHGEGQVLTPRQIGQMFRIAQKIEGMDANQIRDYLAKVTGVAANLDEFEAAVDGYIGDAKARENNGDELLVSQAKLQGLDKIYKFYKSWKNYHVVVPALPGRPGGAQAQMERGLKWKAHMQEQLTIGLKAHGFAGGIPEFEQYISQFEGAYETEARYMVYDILDRYEGLLYRQSERYKNPAVLKQLYQRLGGFRDDYQTFAKNQKITNSRAAWERRPESIVTKGSAPYSREQAQAAAYKANVAKASAQQTIANLSGEHPIFKEDHLPEDRRIDKKRMGQASESELGKLIQAHIAQRMSDLRTARKHLADKPELVYKMDRLEDRFRGQIGFPEGSIFDQIVQDKRQQIENREFAYNMVIMVVAVALGIMSYGATTTVSAIGLGVVGLGLSAKTTYDEYQRYMTENDLSNVGLAEDPSIAWLVVEVAGALLDLGAVVKSVKAIAPAAKAFNATGDLTKFKKALKLLEESKQIDAKVAQIAEKAAISRQAAQASKRAFLELVSPATMNSTPLLKILKSYKLMVEIAVDTVKADVYEFAIYMAKLKQHKQLKEVAHLLDANEGVLRRAFDDGIDIVFDQSGNKNLLEDTVERSTKALKETGEQASKRGLNSGEMAERVKKKIAMRGEAADAQTYKLLFGSDELRTIMKHGKDLGFSDDLVADFLYNASRNNKRIHDVKALKEQMSNYFQVHKQGYPFLFKNMDAFTKFKGGVKNALKRLGINIDDAKIQVHGSSLRTPNAGDVDVQVWLKEADFQKLVDQFAGDFNHAAGDQATYLKNLEKQRNQKWLGPKGTNHRMAGEKKFGEWVAEIMDGKDFVDGVKKDIEITIKSEEAKRIVSIALDF